MPLTVLPLWQGALRRWKETIVCAAVAREKNLCQACLNDLEYAVPFHVRDSVKDAFSLWVIKGSLTCMIQLLAPSIRMRSSRE